MPGTTVPFAAYVDGAVAVAVPVFAYCPEIAVPVAVQVTEPLGAMATTFAVPCPQLIVASSAILSSTTVAVSSVFPVLVTT